MKTWYRAVCDTHKEACHVFVTNPQCTFDYLNEHGVDTQAFLSAHYGCNLRLVWHDDDLDKLWNDYFFWDKAVMEPHLAKHHEEVPTSTK